MRADARTRNLLVPDLLIISPVHGALFATTPPSCPTTPWSRAGGKKGEGVKARCSRALRCLSQVLTELGSYKWLPDSVPQLASSK